MTSAIPGIGQLVYLTNCVIQVGAKAIATPPDTPNQYSADLKVMSDIGINLDALQGPPGPDGQTMFSLRLQREPVVNSPADLPRLNDTPEDIGKYWLIDTLDAQGHVIDERAWVWWGNQWRVVMSGTRGLPGPVPNVTPSVVTLPPDEMSYVHVTGPTTSPSWQFNLALPQGSPAPPLAVNAFPDTAEMSNPAVDSLLAFAGGYAEDGNPIWAPFDIEQLMPQPYSVPQSAFSSFSGYSQRAPIGSFAVPAQSFPWTPVVWGHIGRGGVMLSARPLMIGCEVLLGDPDAGVLLARGIGNTLGEVNIMPHYSSANSPAAAVTPNKPGQKMVVPANHTGAQGTIYVNLYNDGELGLYSFDPQEAQLFVMVMPIQPALPPYVTRYPNLAGAGTLKGKAQRL